MSGQAKVQDSASPVPDEIREILSDTLTERGMGQWWSARNRLLEGHSPAKCWETPGNRRFIIGAANAFAEGVYV
jgi:hypothetical protein